MKLQRTLFAAPALLALAACPKSPPADLPPWEPVPEPGADLVESVVYLVGDAGKALEERSPVIRRLQLEIEEWSCVLQRDSAVLVLWLGDNVYPEGLRPRGTPEFPEDSAHLYAQFTTVTGPCATRHESTSYFLAGNHDWGTGGGEAGQRRLQYMETEMDSVRARGWNVRLVPRAGTSGPAVVDVGEHVRLVFLDTAWWLLGPTATERALVQGRLLGAMQTAGERDVIFAAHHPFESGGPHGGFNPLFKWLGIKFLLAKAGAWLQDLSSGPYKELRQSLRTVFALTRSPLVFAGGHEHTLQVLSQSRPDDPQHILVSGSASKTSDVRGAAGMRFKSSEPGFMRLTITRAGVVDLFVVAVPEDRSWCAQTDAAALEQCMVAGADAFRTVYSYRLRGPRD